MAERRRSVDWSCDLDAIPSDKLAGVVSLQLGVFGWAVAGRIDDGVAVKAISHKHLVGVSIDVIPSGMGGFASRDIDFDSRGIVVVVGVVVVKVCGRLPVEESV